MSVCPQCVGKHFIQARPGTIFERICPLCLGKPYMNSAATPMQVYVGETQDTAYVKSLKEHGWGRIWVRSTPVHYIEEPWAFDNAAYSYFLKGEPLDEAAFMRRLDRATNKLDLMPPQFAVLPDHVGKGMRSAHYSMDWADKLRDHPWKNWYFAVQDGQTVREIACAISGCEGKALIGNDLPGPAHPKITGIFLGGSDKFKLTVSVWACWAHKQGFKFHYGRASTPGRIRAARKANCDSMDTSFPLWTRERFERFVTMWSQPDPQKEFAI